MDLTRVYTKTSKGILEGNTKSRDLTRDHGRILALIDGKSSVSDLLEKNSRLSENRLGEILDELAEYGMIRELDGSVAVDDLGFSSTIIVGEANTQAFFEAQVNLERELRRAEDEDARAKGQDRSTLLNEVKADIEAEADTLKREIADRQKREADAAAQEAARHEAEAKKRRKEDAKKKDEEKAAAAAAQKAGEKAAEQARRDAEAHAKAVAEHARKQLAAETKAREEAEARAQALEVEMFARAEAARKAKQEAAQRAQAEAEAKARLEAEKKAREQAEKQAIAAEKARVAAERKAQEEAAEKARVLKEAEEKAEARRTLEAKIQAEEEAQRRATTEARMREIEQEKRRAEEEVRALAKALDEARLATELESRVKRRIEARAREEDEARQRAEAEAKAKLAEAERLQQEAEMRAQAEAEARQQAEAAKLKAEQDAQARLEAERIARQEAETRALAEAEAQRQAEATRQAAEERASAEREAAERQAREAAEREAQAQALAAAAAQLEAEAKAAQQAAEQAAAQAKIAEEQALAERFAREQAEREAAARAEADAEAQRLAEEEHQRVEAEARAVAEAEEAIRLEAEAVKQQLQREEEARQAQEAAAREAEIERAAAEAARALVESRTRAEAEAREREAARQQARLDAEAAARAEAEEALQRETEAAEREAAEEARLRAEAQARAQAAARSSAFPFLTTKKRKRMHFDAKMVKPALIGLLAILILAVAAVHIVPFNFLVPKFERQLSDSLGQRVVVRDVYFLLYPAPHFKLEGVAIGDLADVRADMLRLTPSWASWISDKQVMRRVELAGVTISADGLNALPVWRRHQAQTPAMRFEEILVKDAKLANRLLDLFSFDATVTLDRGHFTQAQIRSTDQRISIDITPRADALAIQLSASHSVLPMDPRIQFDDLKISAVARPGSMTLSNIDGQFYGGSFSGNAQVHWSDGWIFTTDLGMRQVDIAPLLALFTQNVKATGALEAKVRLTTRASTLETLFDAPQVQATFRLRNGEIAGVDLVRAIQSARSASNVGGKTHFNELSGYMQLANGRYQYRQLKLQTGMISANGSVEFSNERNLSGNLLGELRTRATVLRTPFVLSGTLDTPTLKPAAPRATPVKPAVAEAIPEAQSSP